MEGSPNTPLPITQFTTSAAMLQRPMTRINPSLEALAGLFSCTRFCITNEWRYLSVPLDMVAEWAPVTHNVARRLGLVTLDTCSVH